MNNRRRRRTWHLQRKKEMSKTSTYCPVCRETGEHTPECESEDARIQRDMNEWSKKESEKMATYLFRDSGKRKRTER